MKAEWQGEFTIKYVSWDPGEKKTGRVKWDENANPVAIEELTEAQFDKDLTNTEPTVEVFIVEEYRPYGHIQHTGNKLLTAQRIGDIKGYARRHGIEVVEQPAQILKIAAMWSGTPIVKGHWPDWQSAFLHGYYYLSDKGLIRPKVLDS